MKLVLLHGPALDSSRKKLSELKQKFSADAVVTFEKGSDPKDILASLQTVSIFEEERLVIVENPPEDFILGLQTLNSTATLVIWFDHEVKKLPEGVEVLFFPAVPEASMFPLLDSLGARSPKAFLELAKRNKTSPNDTQYIITMICYLLRSLVATPKNAKDFVRNKNARIRKNFSEEELINLYKYVLETDFKIKSGLIEPSQAEFMIVNKFVSK